MAFRNVRFPDAVSYDAVERIRHGNRVVVVESGARSSLQQWEFPLREFDVSHAMRLKSYMDTVIAFNRTVAEGTLHTWRFKNWLDFRASSGEGVVTSLSGADYQMWRRFTFGGYAKDFKVTLPVAGAVTVAGAGTYTYSDTTGIITAVGAAPTGWSGDYDTLACFATDIAEFVAKSRSGGNLILATEKILILEVRP